jgi:hypothetical protein
MPVTAEGVAMTQAGFISNPLGSGYPAGGIYILMNPSPGMKTIELTTGGVATRACVLTCEEWSDVDPVDPIGAVATYESGNGIQLLHAITPEAVGNTILSAIAQRGGAASGGLFTPDSGVTEITDLVSGTQVDTSDLKAFNGYYTTVGTSSVNAAGTITATGGLTPNSVGILVELRHKSIIAGVSAKTLVGDTSVATGKAEIQAALAQTLDATTISAAGKAAIQSTLATTLGSDTLTSTVVSDIAGALAKALGGDTLSAEAIAALSGALTQTLADATLSSLAIAAITGSLSQTLAGATLVSDNSSGVQAELGATLDDVSVSSEGIAEIASVLAKTLGGATLSADGIAVITGALSKVLTGATLSSSGVQRVMGLLSKSLGSDVLTAALQASSVDIVGIATATLGDATLTANLVTLTFDTMFQPKLGLAALAPIPPSLLKQVDFDFANVASGWPANWSRQIGAPYLPTEVANMRHADPRQIRVYDTAAVTLLVDGEPITAAHIVGPGDSLTTALYWLAKQLDDVSPNFHVFSTDWAIGVQALPPHTAEVAGFTLTPYQSPPAPSILLHAPAGVPFGATALQIQLVRDARPAELFSIAATGDYLLDMRGLAEEINKNVWLQAEAGIGSFKVGTHSGHTVVVTSALQYV